MPAPSAAATKGASAWAPAQVPAMASAHTGEAPSAWKTSVGRKRLVTAVDSGWSSAPVSRVKKSSAACWEESGASLSGRCETRHAVKSNPALSASRAREGLRARAAPTTSP